MNITRSSRKNTDAERADTASGAVMGRRGVLGGLAAIPVLYSLGGAVTSASAATAPAASATTPRPLGASPISGDLVQGVERRYNAPLLTAGTRLVLPAGVKAVSVQDAYTRPRPASTASAWPYLTAADGTKVDASVIPAVGAPTRSALLSGFSEGWYELRHADGRAERVTWDAAELPILWLQGEFGASQHPYGHFFSLSLQPLSRNPFSRSTSPR